MSQPDPNKCHVIYCGIDKFLYPDTGNKIFLFLYLLQMGSNFDSNYAKRLASKLMVAIFQGQFVYAARCAQTRGKILFLRAPHAMVPKVSYELRMTSAANTYLVCTAPESTAVCTAPRKPLVGSPVTRLIPPLESHKQTNSKTTGSTAY